MSVRVGKGIVRVGPRGGVSVYRPGVVGLALRDGYDPVAALGADLLGYFEAQNLASMDISSTMVGAWRCLKTGYEVTQGTDAAKPIYSATSFGGDPGLTFDGTDDVLSAATAPYPTGATPHEIWALVSQAALPADTTQRYAFSMGEGPNYQTTLSRTVVTGVNRARSQLGTGAASIGASNVLTDFSSRHVLRHVVTGSGVTMFADGTASGTASGTPDVRNTRFRLGAFINTVASNFYQGQIAACLITNPLSGSKLTDLETWLNARRRL